MEKNKVCYLDCLEGIKGIDNGVIDLILTDPPYNISRNRKFTRGKSKDVNLNFGEWDNIKDDDYYSWLYQVWKECSRVLKPYGQLITFAPRNWEFEAVLDAIFDIKKLLIWHKTNPTPQFMKISYLSSYEKIIWAVKDNTNPSKFTFNFDNQKEMHDFFESPICMGKERVDHPTQKPLKIVERLIRIHSNKGDLILDPFMGSGTTALACQINGREFIGFENDKEFIDLIKKRFGFGADSFVVIGED